MEQKNDTEIRKKRVRSQQNFITVLCLLCVVFSGFGLIYAARQDKNAIIAEAKKPSSKVSSSQNDADSSHSKADESSLSETDDSSADDTYDSTVDSSTDEHPYAIATDTEDDLSDAVFIGDSRTVGLQNSTTMPKATFYCAVGLHIDTAMTDALITLDNGNMGTVVDALSQKQFGRVYINFGTNELGWPYIDTFQDYYKQLIDKVKELQPDAEIYCEAILPLTASKDAEGDSVNNTNAKTFSDAIKEIAEANGANFLDCNAAVADENGYLPEDASTDGIHLLGEYCIYWQNYIIDNT